MLKDRFNEFFQYELVRVINRTFSAQGTFV